MKANTAYNYGWRGIVVFCSCRIVVLAIVTAAVVFPGMASAQQVPAFSGPGWASDGDFKALERYTFGEDRSALARIEYTVNQASIGVSEGMDVQTLAARLCRVLEGRATPDARRFACRMLKQIGDSCAVPALARCLKDVESAATALWALENIPGEDADRALVKALDNTRGETRIGVINALARRRVAAAVEPLGKLLRDADQDIVRVSALALADMDTPEARNALAEAARSADADKMKLLEAALIRAAEKSPDDAFDTWMQLLPDEKVTDATRCAKLALMIARHPDQALTLLETALSGQNDTVVQAALGFLRARQDSEATQLLVRVARNADLTRHPEFIAALADRGAPEAREMALGLMGSSSADAAAEAFRTLEKVARLDDIPTIIQFAGKSDLVSQAAFQAVARMTKEGVDNRLVELASGKDGSDSALRVTALKLLGERQAVAETSSVMRIAKKADSEVAREAVKTLQVLARPENLSDLLDLLKQYADKPVKEDVIRAIVSVCERIPQPEQRSGVLIDAARKERKKDKPYALALIDALSRVGQQEGLSFIQEELSKKSSAPRKTALIEALASWPNGLALDALRGLLIGGGYQGPDREKLLQGYVRLLRADTQEAPASVVARYRELLDQVVASDQERVMLLSGLSQVVDLDALDLIEEHLNNAAIFNEAANAFVRAAKPLFPADPDGVGARLKSLAEKNIPDNVRNQIAEILAIANNFEGYICAWQVSGPYELSGKTADDLFDMPFPPEMEGVEAVWRVAPMAQEYSRPWAVLLDRILGGSDRVGYLRTYVWSPSTMDCALLLGTNDGCKVWCNGEKIHEFKGGRAFEPDQDRVTLSLREGWNTLLIAVYQYGGAWAASARITAPDGQPVPGLRCSIRPE